jgi:hypothetical protein
MSESWAWRNEKGKGEEGREGKGREGKGCVRVSGCVWFVYPFERGS